MGTKPASTPPSRPGRWTDVATITIGTHSPRLSDALMISVWPRHIKSRYPDLKLQVPSEGFNGPIFAGNPHVEIVNRPSGTPYGDGIEDPVSFFQLPTATAASWAPELHLEPHERAWAHKQLERGQAHESDDKRPLCVLHPWGPVQDVPRVVAFWDELVKRNRGRFRFWQVGLENHPAVVGCEYYLFLDPHRPADVRKLFALIDRADAFIGVNSAPMHVARAFRIPALILVPKTGTEPTSGLYPEHFHLRVEWQGDTLAANSAVDQFLAQLPAGPLRRWSGEV